MSTTVGRLLVNSALPPEFRTDSVLAKDEADAVLAEIAKKYPEKYRDISHKLMQMGSEAVYREGTTLRLSDTVTPIDKRDYIKHVRAQTAAIMADKSLTPQERTQALDGVYNMVQRELKDLTYKTALKRNNPFALQVKSKARGNPSQLTALMTTPGVYEDAHGNLIPNFIERSYGEGLRPSEYWAGTYGARKSVIATKFATRQAGYLGKQLGAAAVGLLVTEDDCGTNHGIPVKTDDKDNIGAVLAKDAGGFKAGTIITRPVLAKLKAKHDEIVVRSPTTCSAKNGVCKQCAGVRESGKLPEIGYNLGVNASSALAERIAQSSLNTKHCLSEGTKVLMADFSCKEIQDIVPGDTVCGSSLYAEFNPVRVVETYDNGPRDCIACLFEQDGIGSYHLIIATPDHKILALDRRDGDYTKTPLGELAIGDDVVIRTDDDTVCYAKYIRGTDAGRRNTYDIHVDHYDHLFVLESGVITSNSGGMATGGERVYAGFPVVEQLVQVPKNFPDRAPLATRDGTVTAIKEAPQGGYHVTIDDDVHYVPADRKLYIKQGDTVEAGDQLSSGIVNPAEVVKYKGIGEGRRYATERLTQAFRDSGYDASRRNIEAVMRTLVNHVVPDDFSGGSIPGEHVDYNTYASRYKPRKDSKLLEPKKAVGHYLEEPVMHYTLGTRVTGKMIDNLHKHGYGRVLVNKEKPTFTPDMLAVRDVPHKEKDWMVQLGSNYLRASLLNSAHTGAESEEHGTNPIPAIAKGVDIGKVPKGTVGY